jgi:uncharacterized sporulation protein YeaH/YhbH (DUF444 family)
MDRQPARQGPELRQEWVKALPVIQAQHREPELTPARDPQDPAFGRDEARGGDQEGVVPGKPQEARRDVDERRDEEMGR